MHTKTVFLPPSLLATFFSAFFRASKSFFFVAPPLHPLSGRATKKKNFFAASLTRDINSILIFSDTIESLKLREVSYAIMKFFNI